MIIDCSKNAGKFENKFTLISNAFFENFENNTEFTYSFDFGAFVIFDSFSELCYNRMKYLTLVNEYIHYKCDVESTHTNNKIIISFSNIEVINNEIIINKIKKLSIIS